MKERERTLMSGLVILMLILWLGFLLHRSPSFAGSFWGGLLGMSGALLMLVPLAYMIVKRNKKFKTAITKHVPMRVLLAWHIYAGILGPILILLHTGHKFESPLGIALTALTLVVVISGFIGRYLMSLFSREIREKKAVLSGLQANYRQIAERLANNPQNNSLLQPFRGFWGEITAALFVRDTPAGATGSAIVETVDPGVMLRLSRSIADVEYAIKMHETFKVWFKKWLKLHIVISMALYVLLALHIWGAVHFGIRWFDPWQSRTSHYNSTISQYRDPGVQTTPSGITTRSELSTEAADRFAGYFGEIFKQYWRSSALIHGIETTVFDYAGLAAEFDREDSAASLAMRALEAVNPSRLGGGNREKTFWINVYNFTAMKLVSTHYPVDSITNLKISGTGDPWGLEAIRVGGRNYSLKEIEVEQLLAEFDDPRIVFAVSCAAVSCPDRSDRIFTPGQLDRQLDDMIRGLLANPTKGLAVDRQRGTLTLSWIMKKDRNLFDGGGTDELLDFVQRYAPAGIRDWIGTNRKNIKVDFFEHDWGLNDIALSDTGP